MVSGDNIKFTEYIKTKRFRADQQKRTQGEVDLSSGLHGTAFMDAWDETYGLMTISIIELKPFEYPIQLEGS